MSGPPMIDVDARLEEEVRKAARALLERPAAPPSGDALAPSDGLTIYQSEHTDPLFVVSSLLAHGVTLMCGRPKVGKSWLALDLALAVARGGRLLGRFKVERSGGVLYCALEESQRRTGGRLRKLLPEPEEALRNIRFIYTLKPLLAGGTAQIDALLAEWRAELVIIDTFLAAVQAASGRDVLRSDYAEVNVLRQLAAKHGIAIVLVHHLRKMAAEYGPDAVAGTTGVTAACDALWIMKRQAAGECVLEVLGREMEEQTYGLRLEAGSRFGWKLIGTGTEVKLSAERQEILELLKAEAPLGPARIAEMLRKNAVTVRRLLQGMLDDGMVARNRDGSYHPGEPLLL